MSEHSLVAAMLAARHHLGYANPDLLAWSRSRWEDWLRVQRGAWPDLEKPALLAVATLTCIEDLPLHVGLMQLLDIPALRCTVFLSLPTEEMVQLTRARARREGWLGLVSVVSGMDEDRIVRRVPASALVAVFPIPDLLPPNAAASIARLARTPNAELESIILSGSGGFVGHAGDYGGLAESREMVASDRLAASLVRIASEDASRLVSGSSSIEDSAISDNAAIDWTGSIDWLEGRVDVPPMDGDGELLVTAFDGDAGGLEVIARHRADLCEPDRRLRIRMPASFLTTTPREIRLQSHDDAHATGTSLLFHVPPSRLEPWMISAFLNRGGGGNPVIRAFAEGVACRLAYAEDEPEILRDIPVVWGVLRESDRVLAQAKAQSLYFFYVDHAYFNRGHRRTYRITRNGYEAGPIRNCPRDRVEELEVEIAPWRKSGRNIIVCPPTDYFMHAHGCLDWLETTMAALQSVTDRPITIRQKPRPGEEMVPLPQALETAHALVTHSSNVAIEAACLGTPVFVAPASAAAPIGRTDLSAIETPVYPDRDQWLAHLAYNQFSFDEIREGRAWRMLLELEERELV